MRITTLSLFGTPKTNYSASSVDVIVVLPDVEFGLDIEDADFVFFADTYVSLTLSEFGLECADDLTFVEGIALSVPTAEFGLEAQTSTFFTDSFFDVPTSEFALECADDLDFSVTESTVVQMDYTGEFNLVCAGDGEILLDGFEFFNKAGNRPLGWTTNVSNMARTEDNVTQGHYTVGLLKETADGPLLLRRTSIATYNGTYKIDVFAPVAVDIIFSLGGAGGATTTLTASGATTISLAYDGTSGAVPSLCTLVAANSGDEVALFVDNFRVEIDDDIIVRIDDVLSVPTSEFGLECADDLVVYTSPFLEVPTAQFGLVTQNINIFSDTVIPVTTSEFGLAVQTVQFAQDTVISGMTKAEFGLDIDEANFLFYTGVKLDVPTSQFRLNVQDVTWYFTVYKEYPVMLDSLFNYEVIGVNLDTVEGDGVMRIFVDNVEAASNIPFNAQSTNIPLSGIIVQRGQDLRVGLLTENGYFRSFNANFALKRI